MKNRLFAVCLVLAAVSPALAADDKVLAGINKIYENDYVTASMEDGKTTILPEASTFVPFSSIDLNRIVCVDGSITDARASEEKGLILSDIVDGAEIFAKYKLKIGATGPAITSEQAVDLFIKCGGERYSIITRPAAIPARTVYLSPGIKKRAAENEALWKGKPIADRVVELITAAHKNSIPAGWKSRSYGARLPVNKFKNLRLYLVRQITVEGEGLELYQYSGEYSGEGEEIYLEERDFGKLLYPKKGKLGITITKKTLKAIGDTTTVYLVIARGGKVR